MNRWDCHVCGCSFWGWYRRLLHMISAHGWPEPDYSTWPRNWSNQPEPPHALEWSTW